MVEEYSAKKKKGWIIKLGFEKAFDHVDWDFLEKIMRNKQFEHKWIKWILGCVKNPRYSIFINGRWRGRVLATRGIQQGDPLSPFIFLLVNEVLGALVDRLHQNELYEGFTVDKEKIHVPILQSSDNTLLFCKYDSHMQTKLKQVIEFYEWCSGQKMNWD